MVCRIRTIHASHADDGPDSIAADQGQSLIGEDHFGEVNITMDENHQVGVVLPAGWSILVHSAEATR